MSYHVILWIDDDIRVLSGLKAYIREIDGVILHTAGTFDEALVEIEKKERIDLILFDMVLMEDGEHAALDRRMGIHVARMALDKGVKMFVAYTVLSRVEVMDAWNNLIAHRSGREHGVKFEHFPKNSAAVKEIQDYIRGALNGKQ